MHARVLGLPDLQHVGCYTSVVFKLYASSWLASGAMVASHSKEPFRQARNIGSVCAVVNPMQQDVMPWRSQLATLRTHICCEH